jgi:hypothetical protein
MHSPHIVNAQKSRALLNRLLQVVRSDHDRDTLVVVGLPLLIVVGAILGLINILAFIHLVAVLLNG